MATLNDDLCRTWSRYQWASVTPVPEPDAPAGWNLSQWVGDQGRGAVHRPSELPCPPETAGGFSGFGHAPGAAARWVPARCPPSPRRGPPRIENHGALGPGPHRRPGSAPGSERRPP